MRTTDKTDIKSGDRLTSKDKLDDKRERVRNLKKLLETPKRIGGEEELVPFSWRNPLVSVSGGKMTKVYKSMIPLDKSLAPSKKNRP